MCADLRDDCGMMSSAGWVGTTVLSLGRPSFAFDSRHIVLRCPIGAPSPASGASAHAPISRRLQTPLSGIVMSASPPTPNTVVRRSFLARLAALGTALAGVAVFPSMSGAQSLARPTHPADAWLDDLKGQHKMIFDCVSLENAGTGSHSRATSTRRTPVPSTSSRTKT